MGKRIGVAVAAVALLTSGCAALQNICDSETNHSAWCELLDRSEAAEEESAEL